MTGVAVLSRDQVRGVDRLAIDEYGMTGLVLMENAGRGCVDMLCRLGVQGPVLICCGTGNNAGDGLVMARHLDLRGIPVRVLCCTDPARLAGDAAHNWRIVCRAELTVHVLDAADPDPQIAGQLDGVDWIVDALLGTGARGGPRPPLDRVIALANASPARRLAVDVPSGLDCETGEVADPTFRADHTCTLVAAKPGLLREHARPVVGAVHVLDIGTPAHLLARFGLRPAYSEAMLGGS